MKPKLIFMYSGQGSQYYHMGKQLFESDTVFRKWMLKLDKTVIGILGKSIVDFIYKNRMKKRDVFDRTLYTSPAIFMIEFALTQALMAKNIRPDYVMGTSLGEICAVTVSGLLNVEQAIIGVITQSQVFEKTCGKGNMIAILHSRDLFDQTPLLYENSEFSSDNFLSHFVISVPESSSSEIQEFLKKKSINFHVLPVRMAFHSSHIDGAYNEYMKIKGFLNRQSLKIPFISCMEAGQITDFNEDYFWDIIRKPILFQKTIKQLEEKNERYAYLDLGPAGTLATFAKYNLLNDSKSTIHSILTPFGQDIKNFNSVIDELKTNQQSVRKTEDKKTMKTIVFPGQGAQKKGMGGDLFDEFKVQTAKADAVLGYSIKELCLEDPDKLLGNTQYTQPALYVVNAFSYLKKIQESNEKPDFVAGHSLGEYNALFASGVFDFETGLWIVKKRGELMGKANGGGMAAIIGMTESDIESVLKKNNLKSISIANLNTPSQIVLAGRSEDIDKAKKVFNDAGAGMYIPLNVSGAFHSPHMASVNEEFTRFMKNIEFSDLKIPVISNVHARPYKKDQIKQTLVKQITHPVKWSESICYLMGKGDMSFEEVGPGNVLTGLINGIIKESGLIDPEIAVKDLEPKSAQAVGATMKNKKSIEISDQHKEPNSSSVVFKIYPESLGSDDFKNDYKLKYAYLTGGMVHGIASKELVVKMGKAGMMGFFGTGALGLEEIEDSIRYIQNELKNEEAYGINVLNGFLEEPTIDLILKHQVKNIEAAAYMLMSPGLVRFRLKGLKKNDDGTVHCGNRILGKISRPEVAESFLSPAPEAIVDKLLNEKKITSEEAELSKMVPMADDLIVEADSGGHTDQANATSLIPSIIRLRDEMMEKYQYAKKIRIGAAGGIGTPEAAAAAFILGADFILTGSINQCTVEARTSDSVKDMLQDINVQDTEYAPAGDMFEIGSKVQVLKKGVFFPARANKLFSLYQHYNSIDDIDEKTRKQLEERYFRRTFDDIFNECKSYYPSFEIDKAHKNPKHKMAMIFKWYFGISTRLALNGDEKRRVDYQVHTGPSLGAFNQWVKGTGYEGWKSRHVDEIAIMLLEETASVLMKRFELIVNLG